MQIEERYTLFTMTIATINRSVQTIKSLALKEFGIRGSNVNCLFFLKRNPEGLTLSQLSALCQEDKAAISRCLHELQDTKLVSMALENGKRYRARFTLTEKGLEVARNLYETILSSVTAGGMDLSEEERACLYGCLSKIQENLQNVIMDYPMKNLVADQKKAP